MLAGLGEVPIPRLGHAGGAPGVYQASGGGSGGEGGGGGQGGQDRLDGGDQGQGPGHRHCPCRVDRHVGGDQSAQGQARVLLLQATKILWGDKYEESFLK
jgi:hypothetical protein